MGTPTVLGDNLVLFNEAFIESTAQVVPPGAQGGKGKIVVNLGDPAATAGLVQRDLLDGAGHFAVTAPAKEVAYPLDHASQLATTPGQIIRLQDGGLLALKAGYIWSDLSPAPSWFGTGNIQFAPTASSPKARGALFLFRSTDGGQPWTLWSTIDAAVVEGGKYGVPSGTSPGRLSRPVLYQDPWTGTIYVSAFGDTGAWDKTGAHDGLVLALDDAAMTWSAILTVPAPLGTDRSSFAMTSTQDHPLVVLKVESSTPTLYYLEGGTMSAGVSVKIPAPDPLGVTSDPQTGGYAGSQICIARIGRQSNGRDAVWIAYPYWTGGGQVYAVGRVVFGGTSAPIVGLTEWVSAPDEKKTSVVMGAFVEAEPSGLTQTPYAVFYWIEVPHNAGIPSGKWLARYLLLADPTGTTAKGVLSVQNGKARHFEGIAMGSYYAGYFSGACFVLGAGLHFLLQWTEAEAIKANIVSFAPLPAPKKQVNDLAIDPLALILSDQVYVTLTLPDPPPDWGLVRADVEARLAAMTVAERQRVLTRVERMRATLDATAAAIKRLEPTGRRHFPTV